MRIPINLASSPHLNLRPYYTATWMATLLLLVLSLLLFGKESQDRGETLLLAEQTQQMEGELERLRQEQQMLEQWLATLAVQQVQTRSAFLNSLILRKSLSWTQMFMDLEKILPPRAQIVSIRPNLNSSAQAELALTVAAPAIPPLVDFLKNLESSPRFGSPVVQSQQFASSRTTEGTIRIEVSTSYRQAPLASGPPVEESRQEAESPVAWADSGPDPGPRGGGSE